MAGVDYREALRDFIARKGEPVEVNSRDREEHPDSPFLWVRTFGWRDNRAAEHIASGCR